MRKFLKLACVACAASLLLCSCGNSNSGSSENTGAVISIDEEDQELLEEIGDDIHVVAASDFADTVGAFDEENVGEVYQLTGYYVTAESEDAVTDYLCDEKENPTVSIMMRYLTTELTEGDRYTVTGVVATEEHGDHSHIVFDVVTVESYSGN
ncbi:MAG: hypothetical protein LUC32_05260 [Clostridiales bacterium]|nr:hypothetical protein [Clostridiales bacterium]